MIFIYSELCIPHFKPCLKASVVASCLKCNVLLPSQGSPSQSVFILTGLLAESPRRHGLLAALLEQWRPRCATWSPAKMYSTRLLMHFRAGLNYWENGRVNLNWVRRWLAQPCVRFFSFFLFYPAYQEINAWNQTEWVFHFIPYLCDRLDLL